MQSVASLVEGYVAGIQILQQSVAGMSREQLLARPCAGKWSTLEVVCHLADSDQVWAQRMKRVIAEERPLLLGYDESKFVAHLACHERDLQEELDLFEQIRRQMGRILKLIPAEAWKRQGVHSERGLVTLAEMVQIETDHVAHHVKFIEEKRKALKLPVRGA